MAEHTYSYFDHDADIGIVGQGSTPEAAFVAAAEAMFAIMADLRCIEPRNEIVIAFDEDDLEFALVTWLNLLLAEARSHGLILGKFQLSRDGSHWRGRVWGEPWRETLERGVEVKGATLTMLSVRHMDNLWDARCIVDV
ncbi:archease [Sulfuriferula sp. AH1]|uniref:archease n=1 Tax=Sulfuriferula sp. AH1 TaxID=1985873 RepID=UPI000B3B81FF|nr:archease [Sulfuriferula sp. AH1]ARU31992.1 archease [Sulfuriferula sp. AH1]